MSEQITVDIDNVCRTCMSRDDAALEDFLSLYDPATADEYTNIMELLNSTTPLLNIQLCDDLPKIICSQCFDQLQSMHAFQQLCLRSDYKLRRLLDCDALAEAKFPQVDETPATPAMFEATLSITPEGPDPLRGGGDCAMDEVKNGLKLELLLKHSAQKAFSNIGNIAKLEEEEEEEGEDGDRTIVKREDHRILEENAAESLLLTGTNNDDSSKAYWEDNEEMRQQEQQEDSELKTKLVELSCPDDKDNNVQSDKLEEIHCVPCSNTNTTSDRQPKRHQCQGHIDNKTANADADYKCDICLRTFAKKASLKIHQQTHNRSKQDFTCEICGKQSKSAHLLAKHIRIHKPCSLEDENSRNSQPPHLTVDLAKPYICEYCHKAFQQSCTLKDHIRTHTGEQPFLCSECGKAFNSSSNMKQHLLRHTGEKRYECPDCPKKFPCLSDLASHKAVHKKIKPHVCDVCGACFGKPYQLKKHKMYHNGEKPHKCEYCEMRFVCADHMRRHMRTHTGEKPYKCKYCVRAFAQSNDLIKHLRSHLGENVYKCELCPKAFRLAAELRVHFAEHKNDDEDTRQRNLKALEEEEAKLKIVLPPNKCKAQGHIDV